MAFDLAGGRRLLLAGGGQWWLWLAAGAVAAVLLLVLYREERRLVSTRVGLALLGLRLAAASVLVGALFEPIAARTWREAVRGRVVVAVDDSESMTTVDLGRPDDQLRALASGPGDRVVGASRRDIARRLVDGPLGKLAADHDARATLFGRDAAPLGPMADLAAALREGPRTGDPARGTTDWTPALARALELTDDAPILGVVLLTDGRQNGPGDPSPLVDRLAARGIPIYPVLIGSDRAPPDSAIASIKAPEGVNRGDVAIVTAVVKLDGHPAGSTVDVTLTRPGAEAMVQPVRVPGDGSRPSVTFRVPLDVVGVTPLTVGVEPGPDDARGDNDRRTVAVRVVDDKARVLLVDGEARWEFRYLRNALIRDPKVAVDAILFHPPTSPSASSEPAYPVAWPVRPLEPAPDSLAGYDLIVVGDVDPLDLPAEVWARLDAFVAARGGTLAIVPGPRSWPTLAGSSALRALLPVLDPSPLLVDPIASIDPSHPALPPGLRLAPGAGPLADPDAWPMLQVGDGPEATSKAWSALPGLPWVIAGRPKPSATVLASALGRERDGAVIASQPYGLGKVLWVGTDATWRWRFRVGDAIHHRFWGQVVRWAGSNTLAVGNRVVRHGPTKPRVAEGEPARLQARVADDAPDVPADLLIAARVFRRGSSGEALAVVPLRPSPGQARVFEGIASPLLTGDYVVRLDAPQLLALSEAQGAGPIPEASLEVVDRDTPERVELAAARDPLDRLAAATGGKVFLDFEAARLPPLLQSRSRPVERTAEVPLWDHPATLILFFALLTAEWALRKRAGLP